MLALSNDAKKYIDRHLNEKGDKPLAFLNVELDKDNKKVLFVKFGEDNKFIVSKALLLAEALTSTKIDKMVEELGINQPNVIDEFWLFEMRDTFDTMDKQMEFIELSSEQKYKEIEEILKDNERSFCFMVSNK